MCASERSYRWVRSRQPLLSATRVPNNGLLTVGPVGSTGLNDVHLLKPASALRWRLLARIRNKKNAERGRAADPAAEPPWGGQPVAEHDRGKAWERWQRAIGNTDRARFLGKSARSAFDFKVNDGYRHELGSVVNSGDRLTLLERHLVASHHGWCRPGFRDAALSKPGCAAVALAAADDFASLSGTLGLWAVCYLEAVLKSADVLA